MGGVKGAVGQLLLLGGPEGGDEKEKQHSDTLLGVCWREGTWTSAIAVINIAMLVSGPHSDQPCLSDLT